jgi:threonine/homoserine/homoserine lactone efflux protein
MPPLAIFLQGLALGLTAAASPGPFQTYLINQTLFGGWRRGAIIAVAPLISDIPIVLIILLLLDQLPLYFLRIISLAGGIFLLYISWGLWRQWRAAGTVQEYADEGSDEQQKPVSRGGYLWRGVMMNALSPGPYTFWALVNGPIVLTAFKQTWLHGLAFLLGFYGMMIGGYLGIAALFNQARRLDPRLVRILTLISLLVLAVFGLILLRRGIWGL